jgi:formamidase
MLKTMSKRVDHRIRINKCVPLASEPCSGHNRWHPEITPILHVNPGEIVRMDTRDAFDCQIGKSSCINDLTDLSLDRVHPMTGPVFINGAVPGDLLEVDIISVDSSDFGYTVQGAQFGFLRDLFTNSHLIKWQITDGYATSVDLPGVRIPGAPFMGVMGVAPSLELMKQITERESDLAARGAFVALPDSREAVPEDSIIADVALKSLPPREFGGNIDVKQLTAGATLRLPVFVDGGLFSTGDAHFAQGDNECCTAIEIGATLTCRFRLIKNDIKLRDITDPEFYRSIAVSADDPAPSAIESRKFFATTGFCRDNEGVNHSEDLNLAARNALLNMIEYLTEERGFSREQAYALCSVAVDLRISEAVNLPNFLVSALIPLDIFVD